jgi:hypothetical protein
MFNPWHPKPPMLSTLTCLLVLVWLFLPVVEPSAVVTYSCLGLIVASDIFTNTTRRAERHARKVSHRFLAKDKETETP